MNVTINRIIGFFIAWVIVAGIITTHLMTEPAKIFIASVAAYFIGVAYAAHNPLTK